MEKDSKSPIYSFIVPLNPGHGEAKECIDGVCTVLDEKIAGSYEVIAIEDPKANDANDEWDQVKGEVVIILDGDLRQRPTTLCDVISAFEEGSDLAFAGQYTTKNATDSEPTLSYLGIRRSALDTIESSDEGKRLVVEVLGPKTIQKLRNRPTTALNGYILKHLQKVIGVRADS